MIYLANSPVLMQLIRVGLEVSEQASLHDRMEAELSSRRWRALSQSVRWEQQGV